MAGLTIINQADFGGGMWLSPSPERIPRDGVYDATNALVDDTGGLYKRGGTSPENTGGPNAQVLWVWEGTLTGGLRRLAATATTLYAVSGSTWTSLGAYTGMATTTDRPAIQSGVMYLPGGKTYDGTTFGTYAGPNSSNHYISVANRLVYSGGPNIAFSGVGTPATVAGTDFWTVPGGGNVLGLAGLRDAAIVFMDLGGTYVISNLSLKLTDTAGNVQQRLDLYSPDLILWPSGADGGTAGVVGYQGGLIVPARDGVWLMRLGTTSEASPALQLLSRPITSLYQSYIAAGCKPGQAAIFNGHYFLPVLIGTTPIDLLVCRLNAPGQPWTHFSSTVLPLALTPTQNGLKLLGAAKLTSTQARIASLQYFQPDASHMLDDVDGVGAIPVMQVTARDYLTGALNASTVIKTKVGYRLTGTNAFDTITAAFGSTDAVGSAGTALTGAAPATNGTLATFTWPIGKRARIARLQLSSSSSQPLAIESLETYIRSSGRQ